MSSITVGIDLAKNVFAVHGVNETGKAELVKPSVSRIGMGSGLVLLESPMDLRSVAATFP